ncbi:MAG: hypothetical protein IPL53_13540 [Ignavibacteria bacterium]|nr:hypothetical protein [Ignavibacteria bacterium]
MYGNSGGSNTAVGYQSSYFGGNVANTSLGYQSLFSSYGNDNTAVGIVHYKPI